VEVIDNDAFSSTGLTSVTLPASVKYISSGVFSKCTGLTSVTFQGTIAAANFSVYSSFPGDLRDKYLAASGGRGTYRRPSGTSETWAKQ